MSENNGEGGNAFFPCLKISELHSTLWDSMIVTEEDLLPHHKDDSSCGDLHTK